MPLLLAEMLRQLGVAGFEEGIVQSEGTVLASVERLRELSDRRWQVIQSRGRSKRIAHNVAKKRPLISLKVIFS